jgi:murein L,D-transpeptidase YcbB/YkuD
LRIYEKLPVYAQASKMPWAPIEKTNVLLTSTVRERLTALGFMHNDSLPEGIRAFQLQNGLNPTGQINQATLDALNVPPAERYRELVHSMNEWAKYPEDANSRYVQVNIPSYTMRLVDHGDDVLNMKVIVGRPSRPTPLLTSKITTIVFNPMWTVPKTILARDVIPGMRANPNYLKEHYDMRVYASYNKDAPEINPATIDWQTANLSNFNYRVTAPASDANPLGRVKFIFENDQDIYMHDTPEKSLFALNDRARSSGCVRLENPMALVQYFYADNNDLNAELVNQYLSSNQTKYIALRNPMPVYITYIPAWVDAQNNVHFAPDIYGNKNVGESAEMKKTIA